MADNFTANAGSGGDTFAADEIGGVKHPRSKISLGADGAASDAVGGSGVNGAGVQRVTIATDDSVSTDLGTLAGAVSGSEIQADIVSSALPTGAATAANQLPDGHNVTVDNASGASAVNIQDGGNSITIDGTVTADAGTNLNTSALALETGGNLATLAGTVSGSEIQADIVSSALPTGAATAANQSTGNSSLGNIEAGYAAEGAALGSGVLLQGDDGTDRKNINVDPTTGDVQVDVTNTVTVDGSGVTQPISAASLPLPSGAATAANQLPDGHNVTIDNASGVSAVNIQDGGNSITVDASSLPLPTGAATSANQTTGNSSLSTIAGAVSGTEMQVDVIAALPTGDNNIGNVDIASSIPAGTNNIGDVDIASHVPGTAATNLGKAQDSAVGATDTGVAMLVKRDDESAAVTPADGDYVVPTCDRHGRIKVTAQPDATSETKRAIIDAASSGDNTLVAAAGAGVKIRVTSLFMVSAGTVNTRFESGAGGTALTGQMNLVANSGFTLPYNPEGWFETADNALLNLELSAAISVDGCLTYVEV